MAPKTGKKRNLTIKQGKFVRVYVETGNACEAYRQAYNTENMKPETIRKRAAELLKNGAIKGAIEELQAGHQKRHEITVDSITDELVGVTAMALKIENPSAAVSAIKAKATIHGLMDKNVKITGADGGPVKVEDVSTGKVLGELMDIFEKHGTP